MLQKRPDIESIIQKFAETLKQQGLKVDKIGGDPLSQSLLYHITFLERQGSPSVLWANLFFLSQNPLFVHPHVIPLAGKIFRYSPRPERVHTV